MTFEEFQNKSRTTAIYPKIGENFIYPTLGLVGEAGEVAEKIKKVLRDKQGLISEETKIELNKELGDVLWYLSQLASELKISLDDIADSNIKKLYSRMERNKLSGEGDNR
mgnify:FL=1